MDLILNELSVNGLSPDPVALRISIGKMMAMRNAAKTRAGVEVYCHRNVSNMAISSGEAFREGLQVLRPNEKRAVFSWLDKNGPFWEDAPTDASGEWYECDGEFVTETGLAEAAHYVENEIDWRTLSFVPSRWERSPIAVTHRKSDDDSRDISVLNYWDMAELGPALIQAQPDPKSWNELEDAARGRFTNLSFTADSFSHLDGQPFAPGVAGKIFSRLSALDKLWAVGGRSSDEGRRIYDNYFMGDRAWFSDSSATEKVRFERGLTFRLGGNDVFCPWHGKLRLAHRQQFRIHFTWPVPPGGQLHVVYLGLKITVD